MRFKKLQFALTTIAFAQLTAIATAVPISGLFNTGVNNGGNAWLVAGTPDIHYTVVAAPGGAFLPVAVDDTVFPFPAWVANNANSRWIGPASTSAVGPGGFYVYRTTFTLPANAVPSTASISGLWATDNAGIDILLNGTSNSQFSPGFVGLVPFSVNNGFVTGLNILDFIVNNGTSATGLRVDQIQGQFQVPEPSTALLVIVGISCAGFVTKRRKSRRNFLVTPHKTLL